MAQQAGGDFETFQRVHSTLSETSGRPVRLDELEEHWRAMGMNGAVFAAILAVVSAQGDGTGGGGGGGDGTGGGGGGGGGTGGSSVPACASTDAGCSAYSLITSGTCDGTAGCAAILDEGACRELHDQVDIVLCVATSPTFPHAPRALRAPRACAAILACLSLHSAPTSRSDCC